MSVIGQAFVEILPITAGFASSLNKEVSEAVEKAESSNSGMFDKLSSLGQKALLGLGAAVVAVGVEAVHMADKFEESHARLETAIAGAGSNIEEFTGQINQQGGAFEKLGYTNAQYQDALARLTTATHDPQTAINDMGLAANIAAQRHMDLTSAAQLVGKVAEGNVSVLKRFGITLTDAGGGAVTTAQAMQALNERFGGAAQAQADTFGGKVKALEATFQDIGAKIGMWLIPKLEDLGSAIVGVIGWFQQHTAVAIGLGIALGTVLVAAIGAYMVTLGMAAVKMANTAASALADMGRWVAGHILGMEGMQTATEKEAASKEASALAAKAAAEQQEASLASLVEALDANTAAMEEMTARQIAMYEGVAGAAVTSAAEQEGALASLDEAMGASAATAEATATEMSASMEGAALAGGGAEVAAGGLMATLGTAVPVIGIAAAAVIGLGIAFSGSGDKASDAGKKIATDFIGSLQSAADPLGTAKQKVAELTQQNKDLVTAYEQLHPESVAGTEAYREAAAAAAATGGSVTLAKDAVAASNPTYRQNTAEIDKVNKSIDQMNAKNAAAADVAKTAADAHKHLGDTVADSQNSFAIYAGVVSDVGDSVSNLSDSQQNLLDKEKAYDDAMSSPTPDIKTQTGALKDLKDAIDGVSGSQVALSSAQSTTAADMAKFADGLGVTIDASGKVVAGSASLSAAQKKVADDTNAATQAQLDLVKVQQQVHAGTLTGKDAALQLSEAQQRVSQTSSDLTTDQQNLAAMTGSTTDNYNLNTEAGRKNTDALNTMITATQDQAKFMKESGASDEVVNGFLATQTQKFDDVWSASGKTKDQIALLNQQYGLIPPEKNTEIDSMVKLDTSQAVLDAQKAIAAMNSDIPVWAIPGYTGKADGGIVIPAAAAGMVTRGPVIAGEGNRLYPEWVIPSDPKYRTRALDLMSSLSVHMLGASGTHPDAATTTRKMGLGLPGMASGGIVVPTTNPFVEAEYETYLASVGDTMAMNGIMPAISGAQRVADNYAGVLDKAYVDITAHVEAMKSAAISKATTWLGVRYLWGGGHGVSEATARAFGVDCSGLVDQVFGIQGTTLTQIGMGTAVPSIAAAQSGDLVFFGAKAPGEPHHVGIYGGGGQMINAPFTGTVVRWDPVSFGGQIYGIRNIGNPGAPTGATGGGGGVNANIALGKSMAAAFGWTSDVQQSAMYQVGLIESGWNNFARNASSGAYGIPQALPESKLPFAGQAAGGSDPTAQISWMINYIFDRYGTPFSALAHENQFHWYDDGGWLHPGLTLAMNTMGRSERVGGGGEPTFAPGSVVVNIDASFSGQPDPGTVRQLQTMVHDGVTSAMTQVLDRVAARRPGG